MMRILYMALVALICLSFTASTVSKTAVKCMIQMKNYTGEGAYIVVSVTDKEGEYKETIYVHGKDPEWYSEIDSWWKFYGKHRPDIDAISGETIAGGERSISVLEIPTQYLNSNHKLRFETAVEDQDYNEVDLELDLTDSNLKSKVDGTGWIRYVRLMPQK
ncbi:DUF2271 domain-containing protein [Nonlabens sp. SCSIO 43208]|uniref:DUF2271 domain-containing protein n=1 Tax=Nonlabens sp. SCSIO 43208 TaxID=2793009 RepID=UPI003D6C5990